MLLAENGSAAGNRTCAGVDSGPSAGLLASTTSSDSVDSVFRFVDPFPSGSFAEVGVNDAATIVGAVWSIRNALSKDEDRPGSGGASGCPTTTRRIRWKPSGRNGVGSWN